jgi:integrase
MAGLARLTGLRRGELFAQRWQNLDESERCLTVREAVYDGTFGTPKTDSRISPDSTVRLRAQADPGLA